MYRVTVRHGRHDNNNNKTKTNKQKTDKQQQQQNINNKIKGGDKRKYQCE